MACTFPRTHKKIQLLLPLIMGLCLNTLYGLKGISQGPVGDCILLGNVQQLPYIPYYPCRTRTPILILEHIFLALCSALAKFWTELIDFSIIIWKYLQNVLQKVIFHQPAECVEKLVCKIISSSSSIVKTTDEAFPRADVWKNVP